MLAHARHRVHARAHPGQVGGRDEGLLYRGARLSAWDEHDVSGLTEVELEVALIADPVLDKAELDAPGVGALRLRLVATKGRDESMTLRDDEGKYAAGVLLDLDYWALIPV